MNEAGAKEVTMPLLLPIDVFQKSGRYELFGPSIFQLMTDIIDHMLWDQLMKNSLYWQQ